MLDRKNILEKRYPQENMGGFVIRCALCIPLSTSVESHHFHILHDFASQRALASEIDCIVAEKSNSNFVHTALP